MRLNRQPKFNVLMVGLVFGAYAIVQPGLSHHVFAEEQKSEVDELQPGSEVAVEKSLAPTEWRSITAPRKFAGLDTLHRGSISVEVRMAQAAELRNLELVTSDEAAALLLGGAVLIGASFGAAALPLLLAHAAYFAFLATATPGLSGLEAYRQSVLAESVGKAEFPQLTQTALQRRLRATNVSADETPERRVEVVILGYGFVRGPQADSACSFLHALIRLDLPGHDTQEDGIFIEPFRRSDDAPPSYCTAAKKFIANGGELARQTWIESSEILAAIVARRLEDRP
jgi:hypothetical protein